MKSLRKAERCLSKACEEFYFAGFPLFSEIAVVNFAVVQRLLGKTDEAKEFCKAFLIRHPNNQGVATALAGCLIVEDDVPSTIKYAKIAYDADPSTKINYKNYLISLYQAEDYDDLIALVSDRENAGFSDIEEKGLSLGLCVVALNEIGEEEKAIDKVKAMKKSPEMIKDAIVAEAIIARKNGASNKDVASIYRNSLKDHPDSSVLLTHFIGHLDSSGLDDAKEKAQAIERIANQRQLLPDEINELGLCYITLKQYDKAVGIFESGEKRYPHETRLLYGHARALSDLGDEEGTYKVLKRYVELGKKDYNALRNLAFSSLETGRLEEAVSIFQKAVGKADEDEEQGELHCQLWELKRRGRYPLKELLRHVMSFGKTFSKDPEKEARFLMMAMLTPSPKEVDSELSEWYGEIRKRLKEFSEEHPQFPYFRSFKIPEDVPDEEKGSHILSELTAIMLPAHLAAQPFRMGIRSVPYPLVLRAELLPEIHSVFDFWSECVCSRDFSRGIHIWFDFNPFDKELEYLSKRETVCVDLNALLSLAELDLLDLLPNHFKLIVFARGTKRQIDNETFKIGRAHSLAEKLETWRLRNRKIIRIRVIDEETDFLEEEIGYKQTNSGIFLPAEKPINRLIGCGVGESVLLAKQLGIPLYSDDSYVRHMAHKEFEVKGFSTIALITQLKKEGKTLLRTETSVFCEMIRKNFRVIPFGKDHFNSRLTELRLKSKAKGRSSLSVQDLLSDSDMSTLLRQFGDTFFKEGWLAQTAVSWWISLLDAEDIDDETLITCLEYPAYAISLQVSGGVLTRIKKHEQEDRLAHVLGFFLLKSYETKTRSVQRAWSVIKSCCERIFSQDIERYKKTLFELLPKWLLEEIGKMNVSDSEKLNQLIMIPCYIPEEDRTRVEKTLIKLRPAILRER